MLRRWLRSRARSELGSPVLQSSAIGLIHFPSLTMQPPPPDEGNSSRPRRIVVGVTHTQAARNALRWAYQRAIANDAVLVIVTAFEPPRPVWTIYGWAGIDARDAAAAAAFVQDNVLREELRSDAPTTRVRTVITRGDPARVLVEAARCADLLVVGRNASRLRRVASRSISRRCANHADCPVVVIRSDVSTKRRPVPTPRTNHSPDAHHARPHAQFELRRPAH